MDIVDTGERRLDLQLFAEEEGAAQEEEKESSAAGDDPGETKEGEVSYTEETFQQKLKEETERLAAKYEEELSAKLKAAKEEAEKTAKMTQAEKEKFELEKKEKEIAQKEQALALRELKAETSRMLAEAKLPEEVLDMVLAEDAEATKKNVESFKEVFDQAVQSAVEERLKGTSPRGGGGTGGGKTAEELAREQFTRAINS